MGVPASRRQAAIGGVTFIALVGAIAILAMIVSSLRGAAEASPGVSGPVTTVGATGSRTTIKWFVGLDGGTTAHEVAAEQAFVAHYNATNDAGIELRLEVADDTAAYDQAKTEIASGESPDIFGPIGVSDVNSFDGLFLDISPEIQKHHVDLSGYDKNVLIAIQDHGVQIGLPYTVDPGFIFYNKDLFEKASLPFPPAQVGEEYQGKPWDWNALASLAARVTLDSSGRNAAQRGFDPNAIVQFGFDFPTTDARVMASTFGPGSFVATGGLLAQIPATWASAYGWYHAAMWTSHIDPTAEEEKGQLLDSGSIASGHVAMALSGPSEMTGYGTSGAFKGWGMAVIPSWLGATTSPAGIDTFSVAQASQHPNQAFEAMLAIQSDPALLAALGGMPADSALQAGWFAAQAQTQSSVFPGNTVEWSVLQEMAGDAALPSPQVYMTDQMIVHYTQFFTELRTAPTLDVRHELDKLQSALQDDLNSLQCLCRALSPD